MDATMSVQLWAGATGAFGGVLLLRISWGRARRSIAFNAAAWALLVAALACGMIAAGAWGVTVVSLCAIGMALLCLAHAGWTAPRGRASASNRRAHMLPERNEPLRLGRRAGTFVLAVPAALIASLIAGLAVRLLCDRAGWREADSNALMLYSMPLIWAVLLVLLLLWPDRRKQAGIVAGPALAGALVLLLGGAGR